MSDLKSQNSQKKNRRGKILDIDLSNDFMGMTPSILATKGEANKCY